MKTSNKTWAAAVAAGLLVVLNGAAGDFNKYVEWRWTPHTIADTNAGVNVRNQMDFTVPVHGPWLTLPKPDSMTVTWITRIPCAGGIQYREKGAEQWGETLWPVKYGQVDYSRDVHSFNLTGLKPGTEYEYRLVSNLDRYRTAYHMVVCEGREIYSFRTVDPKRTSYKVWLTADSHGGSRLCLDPNIERSGAADADYYFFLGDNLEDGPYSDIRYFITFGFLDDITRLWGARKPTIFMRGNHDINGVNTYQYGDYFPQPDGKTYSAFRQGGVLWIALDSMWPAKEKVQNEQVNRYLVEQREWMREMKKTDLWKTAEFRVVMAHVAPFPGEGTPFMSQTFTEFLQDDSREGRIHMYLSGHHHFYWRLNPNSRETRCSKAAPDSFKKIPKYLERYPIPEKFPFVNVTFDQDASVTIDVAPGKLTFRDWNTGKADGALFDAFELTPDGTVKDLVETIAQPMPQPKAKK